MVTNKKLFGLTKVSLRHRENIIITRIYLCHTLFVCCLLFPINELLFAYPDGWSDDIMVSEDTIRHQYTPDVDVSSQNNVWISWDWATWTEGEIYYSKRDSLGNCIIPETSLSNNVSKSWMARIAVDSSDNVHFVWRDESPLGFGLWHAKLANDGSVIVPSHLAVSGAGGIGVSTLYPEIALDKYQHINIAWDEHLSGYNQVSYTKLDSLGSPIITRIRVSPENLNAYWLGVGVDSFANVHVSYRSDTTGLSDRLTYSKLDKDGNMLIDNKILGSGYLPTIIADRAQNLHMVYADPIGPGISIKYLKLDQNGNIVIGPKILNVYVSNNCPHMALDSLQYLHVVWETDSLDANPIMYTKLDTLGDFVIPPMQVVFPPYTPGGGAARIAADRNSRLHLAWVDGRNVTTDIFYKRGENIIPAVEDNHTALIRDFHIEVTPNPFIRKTRITFPLPRNSETTHFTIFDASGRKVYAYNFTELTTTQLWNGTDDRGHLLPAGIYFIQVVAGNKSTVKSVVMLK